MTKPIIIAGVVIDIALVFLAMFNPKTNTLDVPFIGSVALPVLHPQGKMAILASLGGGDETFKPQVNPNLRAALLGYTSHVMTPLESAYYASQIGGLSGGGFGSAPGNGSAPPNPDTEGYTGFSPSKI